MLHGLDVSYEYETPFTGDDGRTVRPDFTVLTDLGETVLWEHLGMLADPRYAAKCATKKAWYARNGILPMEEGEGKRGKLIVTNDLDGVDSVSWRQLAMKVFGI
jgi:hypothetical protein